MSKVTCQCGAIYERTDESVPHRDKGSADCEVCNRELEAWSGGYILTFTLIKRPNE
jgi:hypothetical protein